MDAHTPFYYRLKAILDRTDSLTDAEKQVVQIEEEEVLDDTEGFQFGGIHA